MTTGHDVASKNRRLGASKSQIESVSALCGTSWKASTSAPTPLLSRSELGLLGAAFQRER